MPRTIAAICLGGLLLHATTTAQMQGRPLTVVSATPTGEVGQRADAHEIRILFSEPMIELGAPVTERPDWFSIEPAVSATFSWSGTRTLIATIEPGKSLPFATRFTVRVGGSARSTGGRSLGEPYTFSFVTPTVRLLSAEWYRKDTTAGSPAVIALRFNQPVRASDVAAHAQARYAPHQWNPPTLTGDARDWLEREDRDGLARFDAKVDAVRRVAASTAPIAIHAAESWDQRRFPPAPELAVIETETAPEPEGWLAIVLDSRLPSLEGPETHAAQRTTIRLEPAFFIDPTACNPLCDPASAYSLSLRRGVELGPFARAASVRDVTPGGNGAAVPRGPMPPAPRFRPADGYRWLSMQQIGYERQPPASQWLLRVDPSLQSTDSQTLGYPFVHFVDNGHERPIASWPGAVWEARSGSRVPFLARNLLGAREWLQPVAAAEIMPLLQTLRRPNPPLPDDRHGTDRSLAGTIDALEAHGIDFQRARGGRGAGTVWAAVRASWLPRATGITGSGRLTANTLVQLTNLGLTVKDSPQSTLVFVTRLGDAEPVPSATVLIVNGSNQELWRGTTDRDGVAVAPALPLRLPTNPWALSYLVRAEKDGDSTWVASDWTGDVHPSQFGLRYDLRESGQLLRGSIFTDRGVYKQGDEIQFKAMLRGDTPTGMRMLPEGAAAQVIVLDARGTEVDRRTLKTNRWSSLDWTWRVPESGSLGHHAVRISVPELFRPQAANAQPPSVSASFLVAAFRRPDFRVEASVEADTAVLGAPLRGTIDAQYLFGAPIGARPVRWSVTRERIVEIPTPMRERYPAQQFVFGYFPRTPVPVPPPDAKPVYGRVLENSGTLDPNGRLRVEVPTERGEDSASTYRVEGEVESVSGQRIANRASAVMHPASFYVGLARPPFFVETQKGLDTAIVAVDLSGNARAGVPVTVALLRERWSLERDREYPGSVTWTRIEDVVSESKVTTTGARTPLAIPLREGGCYILRATARDEAGRPTRTETTFYALGRGISAWRSEGNRIELTPERTTWAPGETARILVQSPWERATALVTVEREGIRRHQRIAITSMQDAIEVPIADADIPNVYASVVLVKGRTATDPGPENDDPGKPSFRVGYVQLNVEDASRRLKVDVRADRTEYRPRQDVNVSVAVTDARGGPRASEVTLWAMDHGLLSLTRYEAPDVARAIYAHKAIQVQTQDTRSRLMGRYATASSRAEQQGQPGGGGGRGGGFATRNSLVAGIGAPIDAMQQVLAESVAVAAPASPPPPPPPGQEETVRSDFRPLVFWLGSLATDDAGRATTTVTLPDSLTTYRIIAVAGDLMSHFGAGDSEIRATKPLTMLPAFPRFLARGDRASIGAVITNSTGAAGDALVTIESLQNGVLEIGTERQQTIRLAPGESLPVRFDATALAPGLATVRMRVRLGDETDIFELPLPVIAPARLETVAAYGDTTSSATEKLAIPAGILPAAGGLTVSLASTALVGLGESARYLEEYPYDCAEQVASRALALLLSADLTGVFGRAGVSADDQRAAGLRALNQLYAYQCPDGGFQLFRGRCFQSSPYLTAYILNVMHIARSLQAETSRSAVERGLNFLDRELRTPPPEIQWWPAWSATHAYMVKVLAEHGRRVDPQIGPLYQQAERMPIFALSYLADALAAVKDRGGRYQDVVRRLTNALRVDADRAHVEEVDEPALVWLWNSNVRATAVVLGGLARRGDDEAMAAPLARWLLAARTNGRWSTTQENAVALEALVRYYQRFEAETPQMSATVSLAGTPIGAASFLGRSTTAEQMHLPMAELLRDAAGAVARDLVVSRTGTGRLYYTARLQYLTPQSDRPVDRGMRIERRFERMDGESAGPPGTSFANGDLVRVTLTVSLPHEGRFLAFTDPMPAGFEAVDALLSTTAADLGARATQQTAADRFTWWRRGGFEHVEKHDDRVVAYATRLSAGRHELSYLVRATTAGTFTAQGAYGEAMYAPEITGRSAGTVIDVKR